MRQQYITLSIALNLQAHNLRHLHLNHHRHYPEGQPKTTGRSCQTSRKTEQLTLESVIIISGSLYQTCRLIGCFNPVTDLKVKWGCNDKFYTITTRDHHAIINAMGSDLAMALLLKRTCMGSARGYQLIKCVSMIQQLLS